MVLSSKGTPAEMVGMRGEPVPGSGGIDVR